MKTSLNCVPLYYKYLGQLHRPTAILWKLPWLFLIFLFLLHRTFLLLAQLKASPSISVWVGGEKPPSQRRESPVKLVIPTNTFTNLQSTGTLLGSLYTDMMLASENEGQVHVGEGSVSNTFILDLLWLFLCLRFRPVNHTEIVFKVILPTIVLKQQCAPSLLLSEELDSSLSVV